VSLLPVAQKSLRKDKWRTSRTCYSVRQNLIGGYTHASWSSDLAEHPKFQREDDEDLDYEDLFGDNYLKPNLESRPAIKEEREVSKIHVVNSTIKRVYSLPLDNEDAVLPPVEEVMRKI